MVQSTIWNYIWNNFGGPGTGKSISEICKQTTPQPIKQHLWGQGLSLWNSEATLL